jgi:hypothetical protein
MAKAKQRDRDAAGPSEGEAAVPAGSDTAPPAAPKRPEPPRFTVETSPKGQTLICRSEEQPIDAWLAGAFRACGVLDVDAATTMLAQTIEAGPPDPKRADTVNGVVALLHGLAPKDAIEGMLAAQLVATHQAAMTCLGRAMARDQALKVCQANLGQASRLSRAHVALLAALNRHRGKGGQQKVTVEHVHVHQGGQAIVGAVAPGPGGAGGDS